MQAQLKSKSKMKHLLLQLALIFIFGTSMAVASSFSVTDSGLYYNRMPISYLTSKATLLEMLKSPYRETIYSTEHNIIFDELGVLVIFSGEQIKEIRIAKINRNKTKIDNKKNRYPKNPFTGDLFILDNKYSVPDFYMNEKIVKTLQSKTMSDNHSSYSHLFVDMVDVICGSITAPFIGLVLHPTPNTTNTHLTSLESEKYLQLFPKGLYSISATTIIDSACLANFRKDISNKKIKWDNLKPCPSCTQVTSKSKFTAQIQELCDSIYFSSNELNKIAFLKDSARTEKYKNLSITKLETLIDTSLASGNLSYAVYYTRLFNDEYSRDIKSRLALYFEKLSVSPNEIKIPELGTITSVANAIIAALQVRRLMASTNNPFIDGFNGSSSPNGNARITYINDTTYAKENYEFVTVKFEIKLNGTDYLHPFPKLIVKNELGSTILPKSIMWVSLGISMSELSGRGEYEIIFELPKQRNYNQLTFYLDSYNAGKTKL